MSLKSPRLTLAPISEQNQAAFLNFIANFEHTNPTLQGLLEQHKCSVVQLASKIHTGVYLIHPSQWQQVGSTTTFPPQHKASKSNKILGVISIITLGGIPRLDVFVHPAYRGQGYATEAAKVMLKQQFLPQQRVADLFKMKKHPKVNYCAMLCNDTDQNRIAEKLGMQLQSTVYVEDEPYGLWSISKEEFCDLWQE
ncbi:hypothetical protein EDD86DRAFT_198102 [Gorgonomyces haynaldii]|nr:hypothetical protein EDD86DRAFT_198102 [Gorgonomyces haynaldii]